jgi:hypothetical protein
LPEHSQPCEGEPIFVDDVTVLARPERNPLKRALVRALYRLALRR